MFATIPYYLDLKTVFKRNGYTVQDTDVSITVKKGKDLIAHYDVGLFGAPWLNLWAQDSGIRGVSGFPIGSSKPGARSKQGLLAMSSPKFVCDTLGQDISAIESDCKAIELFSSNLILRQEFHEDGLPKLEPFADLFKLGGVQVRGKHEFMDENDDGVSTIDFLSVDEDGNLVEVPFYYAIDMKRRNQIPKDIPANWFKVIRKLALSHNYDNTTGVLYVSNTIGASYGFPPTAKHLQLGSLDLTIEDWEAKDLPPGNAGASSHPVEVFQDTGATWVELVNEFMSNPSRTTYQQLEKATVVKQAFDDMNKLKEYKMGTNNRSLAGEIRKLMLGQDKCKTYEEYANMIRERVNPKGPEYFLIILFRLKGLVRNTVDGKVYYDKC